MSISKSPETSITQYFDRYEQKIKTEKVYGHKAIDFLYEHPFGQKLAKKLIKPLPSKLLGLYHNSSLSRHKIPSFIREYSINMNEYLPEKYHDFNQFFIRKFTPQARIWNTDPSTMPAFCEARYFAYAQQNDSHTIPVKGQFLSAKSLLSSQLSKWSQYFDQGPLLLARLCPVDYHRFHFPDDGQLLDFQQIPGVLHSVNPKALKTFNDILCTNERHVSILQTKNFGKLAFIEVGALGVGKIIQNPFQNNERTFTRGQEKGYFLFGGSTVIVLGENSGKSFRPDNDLLDNTFNKLETFIKLGDHLAKVHSFNEV